MRGRYHPDFRESGDYDPLLQSHTAVSVPDFSLISAGQAPSRQVGGGLWGLVGGVLWGPVGGASRIQEVVFIRSPIRKKHQSCSQGNRENGPD